MDRETGKDGQMDNAKTISLRLSQGINPHYHNSNLILHTVSRLVDEVIPSDHPRRVVYYMPFF